MTKLHLGCGSRNFGDDWIHIDASNYPHISSHSLTELPFSNKSVDLIYASHVIEYFDYNEAFSVLKEWKRVLRSAGILRVAVPDFRAIADLYLRNAFPIKSFIGPLYGKMKVNDVYLYHKIAFDFDSLSNLLIDVGFTNVRVYDWRKTEHSFFDDHSQAYLPHMDKETGTLISLNVECTN